MNIFILDWDPAAAARQHVDKHVVKMVLESAQLLSTAHRVLDGDEQRLLPGETLVQDEATKRFKIQHRMVYAATHVNHPCAVWVRQSAANYDWVYRLMLELDAERQHRFTPEVGKTVRELGEYLASRPRNLPAGSLTAPAQAMPAELRSEDPVAAYRQYYLHAKRGLARWSKRTPPSWWA